MFFRKLNKHKSKQKHWAKQFALSYIPKILNLVPTVAMPFIALSVKIWWSLFIEHSHQLHEFSAKLIIFYKKVFFKLSIGDIRKVMAVNRKLRKALFYILTKCIRENRKKSKRKKVWLKDLFWKRENRGANHQTF